MIKKHTLSKSDIKKVCDILRRDDGVGAKNYVEQLSWLLFLRVFENVEGELRELAEAEGKKYQTIIDQEYQWSSWAKKDWKDKDELIHFVNQKLFPYLKNLKGSKEKDKIGEVFRELAGNLIRSAHNLLDIIDILNQIEMRHFQDTHLLSQVYEEILQEMGSEGGWAGEFYTPRPIIRLMIKIVNPKLGETIFDPFVGSGGFLVESFDYIQEGTKNIGVKEWDVLQNKTFSGQEKTPLPYLIGTMNMMLHRILVPNLTRSNTFMEDIHNLPESSKKNVILTNPPFGGKEHQSVQNNFPIPVGATEGLALRYVMKRLKNGGRCGIVLPEGNIVFGGGAFQKIRQELLEKFNVHSIISLPQGAFAQMGAGIKTNLIFFDKTGSTKEIWYGELKGKFTKNKKIKDADLNNLFTQFKNREISDNSWNVKIEELKKNGYNLTPNNPNKKNDEIKSPDELAKDIVKNQKFLDILVEEFNKLQEEIFNNLPKNWKEIKFGDYCDFKGGKQPPKSTFKYEPQDAYVRLLQIRDFGKREEPVYVSVKNNLTYVRKDDVLIARYGASVGKILTGKEGVINVAIMKTEPKKGLNKKYLYYFLLNPKFQSYITSIPGRMAQAGFDKSVLVDIKIPMPFRDNHPDENEQIKIVEKFDKVFSKMNEVDILYKKQFVYLCELKQSILNRIYKG